MNIDNHIEVFWLDDITHKNILFKCLIHANMPYFSENMINKLETRKVFFISHFEILNFEAGEDPYMEFLNSYCSFETIIDTIIKFTLVMFKFNIKTIKVDPLLNFLLINTLRKLDEKLQSKKYHEFFLTTAKKTMETIISPLISSNMPIQLKYLSELDFDTINSLIKFGNTQLSHTFSNFLSSTHFAKETVLGAVKNAIQQTLLLKRITIDITKSKLTYLHDKRLVTNLCMSSKPISNTMKYEICPNIGYYSHDIRKKTGHVCIIIPGFTSEGENHHDSWAKFANQLDHTDFYFFNWESKTMIGLTQNVIANLHKLANPLFTLDILNKNNLFVEAKKSAKEFGKLLAFIIISNDIFKNQIVTLVGFSLGCHVIKHCVKTLYELSELDEAACNFISNLIFIAGATYFSDETDKWNLILNKIVNGQIINCYSKNDDILRYLYKITIGKTPLGLEYKNGLKNIQFHGFGHLNYKSKIDGVRDKINIELL